MIKNSNKNGIIPVHDTEMLGDEAGEDHEDSEFNC